MSKISIVFDRLRTEEKMLQKEATELGHETSLIDAKTTQFNTSSQIQDFDFGDVILERCVSYYRGLYFTACLEFLDTPVINKFNVSTICGNKMLTSILLKKNNIPTPKTYFSFSADAARENLENVGYPMDIRVITIGDKAVTAMYRKSSGNFKTNIALGAEPEICNITNEIEDLCAKASKAVGGGILGVDLMEDKEKGLVVHEVNNTVEFKGLVKVADVNIPKEMIEFALNSIRK